jgi:hypothetical protein
MENTENGNVVILKFNKPIISKGNAFSSLSTLDTDNKTATARILEINNAVKKAHEDILRNALGLLYKDMEEANIDGIDISFEPKSISCSSSYVATQTSEGWIKLSKKGVKNHSHINILDNVCIGIRSVDCVKGVNTEKYVFEFSSRHSKRFNNYPERCEEWKEIEANMFKSVKDFIDQVN